MHVMKRLAVPGLLLMFVLAAVIAYSAKKNNSDPRQPLLAPLQQQSNQRAFNDEASSIDGRFESNKKQSEAFSASEVSVYRKYLCDPAASSACETSMLQGSTQEESLWLYKNGYPTQEEIESVDNRSISLEELARRSNSGNLVDSGLYGRRLINDGNFSTAANVLSSAIAKGSIFSVYEMSRLHAAKDYKQSNLHESAAYVRAAYLLGDRDASQRLYLAYPRFSGQDFLMADRRAYEISQGISKLRLRNGVAANSPRP